MTAYGGFQECHSSVPGVLALSIRHLRIVSSTLLIAENISPLFQQLSQVIILLYGQGMADSEMVTLVDLLSAEYGEIKLSAKESLILQRWRLQYR